MLLRILIKQRDDGVFVVKLRKDDREFLINKGNTGPLVEFLDYVHGKLLAVYDGDLERFLNRSEHKETV